METQDARSAGHVEQHALSRVPLNDNDTYRMMVLRLEQSEEEVDQQLIQTALDLGIDVSEPSSPESALAELTDNVSTLEISPPQPGTSTTTEHSVQSSSQTSDSTNAHSDSSNEYRRHTKTPSLTATSITSAASASSASQHSHYSKVKKSIRRISTLRRRKPSFPFAPTFFAPQTYLDRPATRRISTADQASITAKPPFDSLSLDHSSPSDNRLQEVDSACCAPVTYSPQPPPTPSEQHESTTPESSELYQEPEIIPPPSPSTIEAQHRSLNHPLLKKLHTTQLQEQLRFISFQASQTRLLQTAHLRAKRSALTSYKARQYKLEATHADALVSLEHRHLSAEEDLRKGLEAEKRGCDVKLKHMQAYCNPRATVEGMPRREITKADYRQLELQYHIRDGMDILHTSKINVLREKQAKQLERILAKQEAELSQAGTDFEQELQDLQKGFEDEDENQKIEFTKRRKRLVKRWNLMESIERRRLEQETEEGYGKMPDIIWKEEEGMAGLKDSPSSALDLGWPVEIDAEDSVLLDESE